MEFYEVVEQVSELLQRRKRVPYRVLKREFELDDEYIEDIKAELIDAQRVAKDEDGKVLVWTDEEGSTDVENRGGGERATPPLQSLAPAHEASEAERRQLTVMFCDLVGSTALSGQLDPEELREVVRAYQQTSAEVIERYEGHIAQYLGDGLLVYFGYPSAHEDDAARAVRAGLEIISALPHLSAPSPLQPSPASPHPNPRPKGARGLQVRIGIHTGPVVVGEMGGGRRQEQLALGETPNIAARVQGQAQPDEVVISTATYQLIEGLFECEDRGQPELRGVTTPLTLYHVIKEGEAQSRFQVVARRGLTPLVGREHEHGLLRERWEQVKDGAGQVVLLCGEPGIGKSRLVEQLKETVEQDGARCVELRCSPYSQNSALQPVIEHLQRFLQLGPEDTQETNVEKLYQALGRYRFPEEDTLPLLAALLSLPHPADVPPLTLSPQKQKEKTNEAIVAWLCEEAAQQAVTYAWEDLHWADPSTLELLTLFLDQVPTTRLLAVLTYRPEFTPPWGAHSYLSQLTLSRLGRSYVETMVEKVTGGKALPTEVVQQIANKTDGIPLFVEELTKMVMESDLVKEVNGHYELSGPLPPLAIPSTLQDSLMARLDRLATVREIAQLGATIGREFPYDLLQAVSPLDEEALQQGLRQLVDSELIFQSGVLPQAQYLFKHALVQDTAYQSLLKSKRQQLHHQVAQILEEQFTETVETQPELVAHHYTEASLIEQAIPYWQRAGQRANQRSANVEAIHYLTQGVELLQSLPDTPERAQQELPFCIALGGPLIATRGFATPEVGAVYTRARELCRQIGETPQIFPVLWGMCAFYSVRAEWHTAHELAEQLLNLAQSVQDNALLIEAHYAVGQALYAQGEFTLGREHLKKILTLYDPEQHHSLAFVYGLDPGVMGKTMLASTLVFLGYLDQARQTIHEALTLAKEVSHPNSLAFSLNSAGWIFYRCRDEQTALEQAETLITLSTDQGYALYLTMSTILRGCVMTARGQRAEGITQMRSALDACRATGAETTQPRFLSLLAEAYGQEGQTEEGMTLLAEAQALVDKSGEHVDEAELYRIKGEVLLQPKGHSVESRVTEAEECFYKAVAIAQRQKAKTMELRASMSLSRLWQQQGKTVEAHHLLSEVYNWFTEGFDTADLKDAKTLLDQLS